MQKNYLRVVTIITGPMKVTLVGTTILFRPELEKTFIEKAFQPIETTDLKTHTSSDGVNKTTKHMNEPYKGFLT